ncbi:hypothetical protein NLJ89_g2654 [Agrocybe chaxingu]|uniref:P-loop containing nucleoside triphosphate hydrolase protein n=1 Tax=Agrocybe chaxingu TaxID=84603 RepID=A0A9W8K6W9_9AGAR|nr:hypothetical protein NLJ89_g2654 [Agrocybe chaxingu]
MDEKSTVVAEHRWRHLMPQTDEKVEHASTELQPTHKDIPPVSFVQLFRYSTRFELFLDFIGLLAAAAAGAAQPLISLMFGDLTQEFVDFSKVVALAKSGDQDAIANLPQAAAEFRRSSSQTASYLVYLGIGMLACTFVYMYTWVYTAEVNAKRIRENYLRAVLRQDIAFFDNVGAGEVATRIQMDTHLVQQGMSEKVALVVNFVSAFICGFVLGYVKSWRLALAMTAIIPCLAVTSGAWDYFVAKYMQKSLKHTAQGGSLAEEVISTIRTAQAFGIQKTLSRLYDGHIEKSFRIGLKSSLWEGGGTALFFFVDYSAYALAFAFGTTLINAGNADAGTVIAVLLAIVIGSFSLSMLVPEMQAITHGRAAAAKLYDTIDRVSDIDSANPDGLKPTKVDGEITLEGVKFAYPSRPTMQVIKGLDVSFSAGKTAALVGASGSGKSTIIALVERFYDPTEGVVRLDGARPFRHHYQRQRRAWLDRHSMGERPEEEKDRLIKSACLKANADGFISKLPLGYDTMVGERGFLLSGGQKQRVAIARAIVSDPRVLLLDEATSALDTQSEGIVQDALEKAAAGRTTITIAHRLSTVKDADVIYVMGDGLILERGTHDELLEAGGPYAGLVAAQKLRDHTELDLETDDSGSDSSKEDMEKAAREEIPLGRKNTQQSLASEVLSQRRKIKGAEGHESYHLLYLFRRMGALMRDQWQKYLFGTIFSCVSGMVYPAFGIVFAKGIEGFSALEASERRRQGDRNALWLFVIAIISGSAMGLQNLFFSATAARLTARLRSLSFKSILRQDIEFFDKDENSTGVLTSELGENPQKVNGLAGITLGAIIQSIATLVGGCILGVIFIWKVGLVGIACTPLLVSAGYIRLRVVVLKDEANKKAHEESAQMACEAASSIRTVASLTRENECVRLYSDSLEEPLRKAKKTALWSNLLYAFSQAAGFFVIALIFWYGAILVSKQEASSFQFFVGLMATTFGAIQAGTMFSFVPDVSSAKSASSDIINLLDSMPEIDADSTEGKIVERQSVKGHIKFENIHFRYPTRPGVRVLRGLSFEVLPGTYIALVGASGSGKSTTIQLIERFYDPLVGEIYLDGERITELNLQEYRKHLALVSQEPTLYAGSVRFNILLGAIKPESEVTQEEIEEACRNANILDFIQGLPQGFDTEIGGKGSQLSGGQKQRIAIARALLRNPKVLLLDEATSALDSNSEKVVQAALDQAAKGRTTIAIAHRLSTIQNADRIYFIKDGCVSESGTHDHLLAKRGNYYDYVQLQALSKHD